MNKDLHFSSESSEWSTPDDFYKEQNKKHGFTMDVCATKENAKCDKFLTKEDGGLSYTWDGVCWMNPPYGRAK